MASTELLEQFKILKDALIAEELLKRLATSYMLVHEVDELRVATHDVIVLLWHEGSYYRLPFLVIFVYPAIPLQKLSTHECGTSSGLYEKVEARSLGHEENEMGRHPQVRHKALAARHHRVAEYCDRIVASTGMLKRTLKRVEHLIHTRKTAGLTDLAAWADDLTAIDALAPVALRRRVPRASSLPGSRRDDSLRPLRQQYLAAPRGCDVNLTA